MLTSPTLSTGTSHRRGYGRSHGAHGEGRLVLLQAFEVDDQDVLARSCHWLAGMVIVFLAVAAGYFVFAMGVRAAEGLAKCYSDASKAQNGADETELEARDARL
ncbi:hypothetical protein DL771_002443 [Monosporascus sp. 5C6A]|nr:hypothetical protein DL771_002443 [Monosporascus sp. 5C6A]